MKYEIFHETVFSYSAPVTYSHNILKLQAANTEIQRLEEFVLEISPHADELIEFSDYFSNNTKKLFIKGSHDTLNVTAKSVVFLDVDKIARRLDSYRNIYLTLDELKEYLQINYDQDILFLKQFLFPSRLIAAPSDAIIEYANESFKKYKNIYDGVKDFVSRIFNDFEFVSGFSDITTPVEVIFSTRKGVCQDFASFAISALRALGIPTRYASGYIQTLPPKGKEKLFGVDASHAWISVYFAQYGWIDFDPTNNKLVNEEYILLGYGRDYNDITPLKGIVQGGGISELAVRVNVKMIED